MVRPAPESIGVEGKERTRALRQVVALLLRASSPEAQRLGSALAGSGAPGRLDAGDAPGFRAEVGAAVRRLWPDGATPFPVSWVVQAIGLEARPGA